MWEFCSWRAQPSAGSAALRTQGGENKSWGCQRERRGMGRAWNTSPGHGSSSVCHCSNPGTPLPTSLIPYNSWKIPSVPKNVQGCISMSYRHGASDPQHPKFPGGGRAGNVRKERSLVFFSWKMGFLLDLLEGEQGWLRDLLWDLLWGL